MAIATSPMIVAATHSVQFGFSRQTLKQCVPKACQRCAVNFARLAGDDGAMMKACAEARCLGIANGGHPVGGIRHAL